MIGPKPPRVEVPPDAVLLASSTGEIKFASDRAERMFGYPTGALQGRQIATLLSDEYRTAYVDRQHELLASTEMNQLAVALEAQALRAEGTEVPVRLSVVRLNGNDAEIVVTIHDLSVDRRERADLEVLHEVAVRSSGVLDPGVLGGLVVERARSLLQGQDATLLWWDPSISALRTLADTFERPYARPVRIGEGTAGIVFQTGLQLVVEDYPAWDHAVPDALSRGMKSVAAVPLLVRDIPVGALTVSFTTPRRFGDQDLRLLVLLAAQVAPALEAARLHDALLKMSSELQDASEAKSRFLASMSHELRTPLNAIIGFSELLIDAPEGAYEAAKRAKFLGQIRGSGLNLLALINDILDLSKVEAGQMTLGVSEFDLGATITSTIETVSPMAEQKAITVELAPAAGLRIEADQGKVRQMLLNLLSNAIKFTPRSGRVTVSFEQRGDEVTVMVEDTGTGIAPGDLSRLFVDFQQLDSREQGTGLGLALTRRLAELHGGRVGVESTLGAGSRFVITLPLRRPTYDRVEVPYEPESNPAGPLVLVVEDQANAAELIALNLRRAGYRVEVLSSGQQVLAKAIELQPSAITLDVLLPEPDGWDILRSLKESSKTKDIPVVVISVLDDRSLGFALGADDYLVKPVSRDALLNFMAVHGLRGQDGDRRRTVLAIDDDPSALRLLKDTLEPEFRVLTALDPIAGISAARAEHPDAMILDLVMPGMTGFEVAAEIKSHSATSAIPILILTAKDLTDAEKARLNGHVNSVMQKGEGATANLLEWLRGEVARKAAR